MLPQTSGCPRLQDLHRGNPKGRLTEDQEGEQSRKCIPLPSPGTTQPGAWGPELCPPVEASALPGTLSTPSAGASSPLLGIPICQAVPSSAAMLLGGGWEP